MAAFDRDPALERQQIQEISLNVARRVLKVLERSRFAPPMIAGDIEITARIISGIQRETDQIMAAVPPYEPLEFAVLTHILSSQQHALNLLEHLETKMSGLAAPSPQPAPSRAHAELLAASRAIEEDAQRYAQQGFAALRPPTAQSPSPGFAVPEQRHPLRQPPPQPQRPIPATAQTPRPQPKRQEKSKRQPVNYVAWLSDLRAGIANPKNAGKTAASAVAVALLIGVLSFMPSSDDHKHRQSNVAPGQKLDGRLGASEADTTAASLPGSSAEAATIVSPAALSAEQAVEQPYLIVLTTRRNTEEIQQDFRSFKASYPSLLGTAKARVDRVQGQDRQTYYRLSLIPPQARDDAKSLCRNLKAAGLTGCWLKPVPLN
ncbi:hypothetical protein [Hyphomicrobium sp.]|uniref:hypothetical protein n=1 Tax=Hyphomicrobium sp. TaxID=82 RepID=UPI002E381F76|nr:hypothetical protein [Hyphomicrobium sp.]HEX2842673.1 hypothetical protein [Hyphomicrobium sp.]